MVDFTFNVGRQLQSLLVSGSIADTTVSVNGPLKKMTVAGSITDSSIYAPGTTDATKQKQSVALGSLSVGLGTTMWLFERLGCRTPFLHRLTRTLSLAAQLGRTEPDQAPAPFSRCKLSR